MPLARHLTSRRNMGLQGRVFVPHLQAIQQTKFHDFAFVLDETGSVTVRSDAGAARLKSPETWPSSVAKAPQT